MVFPLFPAKQDEVPPSDPFQDEWEDFLRLHCSVGRHTAATYEQVAQAGPATRPLEFPAPTVHSCVRTNLRARDHRTGRVHNVANVLLPQLSCRHIRSQHTLQNSRAYVIKKKICKSIYGVVRLCVVLQRCKQSSHDHTAIDDDDDDDPVEWESTDELVVVKASSWVKIRRLRGRHLEDPIKEVASLQYLGTYCPHVIGCSDALQDEDYLYTILPHCQGGEFYGRMMGLAPHHTESERLIQHPRARVDEDQARTWFRQILMGLNHLQLKGVCHRDISLENILVNEQDQLVIIDLGLGIRVPFNDPFHPGQVTDVSAGTVRRLMKAQGQCGKLMYAAPECIAPDEEGFDGFATDLFSAGVILFVLLVGLAPFRWAHESDKRYAKIASGKLKELLESLDIEPSPEACDLLQNMLWRNPQRRLTLAQVLSHPWVLGEKMPTADEDVSPLVTVHPEPATTRQRDSKVAADLKTASVPTAKGTNSRYRAMHNLLRPRRTGISRRDIA